MHLIVLFTLLLVAERPPAAENARTSSLSHLRRNEDLAIYIIRFINLTDGEKKKFAEYLAYLKSIASWHPIIVRLLQRAESDSFCIHVYSFSRYPVNNRGHTFSRQFHLNEELELKWADVLEQRADGVTFRTHGENFKADVIISSEGLDPGETGMYPPYWSLAILDELEHSVDLNFKGLSLQYEQAVSEHYYLYKTLNDENNALEAQALSLDEAGSSPAEKEMNNKKAKSLRDAELCPNIVRSKYETFKESYERLQKDGLSMLVPLAPG
jgi:hypothetical protein